MYIEHEDNYERRANANSNLRYLSEINEITKPNLSSQVKKFEHLKEEEAYVQLAEFPSSRKYENKEEALAQWAEFLQSS